MFELILVASIWFASLIAVYVGFAYWQERIHRKALQEFLAEKSPYYIRTDQGWQRKTM